MGSCNLVLVYGIAWQYTLGRIFFLWQNIDMGCIWRLVPAWSAQRTLPSRDGVVHGHVDRCDGWEEKKTTGYACHENVWIFFFLDFFRFRN